MSDNNLKKKKTIMSVTKQQQCTSCASQSKGSCLCFVFCNMLRTNLFVRPVYVNTFFFKKLPSTTFNSGLFIQIWWFIYTYLFKLSIIHTIVTKHVS